MVEIRSSECKARQNWLKKRSFQRVNGHIEADFNAALCACVEFQQPLLGLADSIGRRIDTAGSGFGGDAG